MNEYELITDIDNSGNENENVNYSLVENADNSYNDFIYNELSYIHNGIIIQCIITFSILVFMAYSYILKGFKK